MKKLTKSLLEKFKKNMKEIVFFNINKYEQENNPFHISFENDKPHYTFYDYINDENYEISYKQFQELYKEFEKYSMQNPSIELLF